MKSPEELMLSGIKNLLSLFSDQGDRKQFEELIDAVFKCCRHPLFMEKMQPVIEQIKAISEELAPEVKPKP
jgi:hypothetical protein